MKNPLIRRFPKELKSELGKYLVIFLFIANTISVVSGWNVAGNSMSATYDESFEKYSIEDGNFELYSKADNSFGDNEFTVSGLVALSDYSALFSSPSDMMFDAVKFGVAIVTGKCFDSLGENGLHCSYSWKYDKRPADNVQSKELSEEFLENLYKQSVLHGNTVKEYILGYTNQAIIFTGDDIKGDSTFITIFLYIVVVIIAFVFAITTGNTIAKESAVIGTLRATGYTKGELIRHYMSMPMLVTLAGAVAGNILGYTELENFAASAYYGSYSLPTYITLWNPKAFINTTIIPLIIMYTINFVMLSGKLSLSPLKFIRRDLSRKQKKKAFKLNTKIGIMKRFRLRIIFQNIPNYATIFVGIFFANAILLFRFLFTPMLDKYQEDITKNLLADNQYLLKAPVETIAGAEKYAVNTLKTPKGRLKSEEVTVSGIYYYLAALSVFMGRKNFNSKFGNDADYFSGYFSEKEITDIDEMYIAAEITEDDLTKTSRQLKISMGSMMNIFLVFGIVMFMMILYLLSKLIIEKNSQSISITKILGYQNSEINSVYIMTTSIVVVISMLVTIPVADIALKYICEYFFKEYPGWLPYYVAPSVFVKMSVMGIVSYAVIAFFQIVKKVPLADAFKNVE